MSTYCRMQCIIVVFGATGLQGGSVTVHGVTQDVLKPSAKVLESLSAEMVTADINDTSTLMKALEGAYAVFAVTGYLETGSSETEIKQDKAIADVAKEAGFQHLIWSSLPNVTQISRELSQVYIREIGIPTSFYLPGFFMSILPGIMFRQLPPNNDRTLALPIPADSPMSCLATVEDTGKYVKGILLNCEQTFGKITYGAMDYYTLNDITAKTLQPPAQAVHELTQNMLLMGNVSYCGGADVKDDHVFLVDELDNFEGLHASISCLCRFEVEEAALLCSKGPAGK
ncbi:hypothetical protein BJ878DRAFT_532367 [Calycina marina]|uniref:NmrA-like domain-containing protein n=1 Tax=Calycina marina TaxID=1763456 RepID=A0A9P7Z9G3_9HELO|nr:hypothetical protein BJ878DRAFT_532367 [Calycina marina]